MGGPKAVAEATGSAAYCRFSGNQVRFATFLFSGRRLVVPFVDKPAFPQSALHFLEIVNALALVELRDSSLVNHVKRTHLTSVRGPPVINRCLRAV